MKKDAAPQRTQFIMMFFAFATGMILSNLISLQSLESETKGSEEVLFIYRGIEKTQAQIRESDKIKINELNQQKIKLIETAALNQYFLDEAKKQNLDIELVAKNSLKWQPVSDEDVNRFYMQNKKKLNKPFYEMEKYIKYKLEQSRVNVARRHLLNELINRGDLAILPRE